MEGWSSQIWTGRAAGRRHLAVDCKSADIVALCYFIACTLWSYSCSCSAKLEMMVCEYSTRWGSTHDSEDSAHVCYLWYTASHYLICQASAHYKSATP